MLESDYCRVGDLEKLTIVNRLLRDIVVECWAQGDDLAKFKRRRTHLIRVAGAMLAEWYEGVSDLEEDSDE